MLTPKECLICGQPWRGGAQAPGGPLPERVRVFYACGSSISYWVDQMNFYHIRIKNCLAEEGAKLK